MFEGFIEELCESEGLLDISGLGKATQSSFSHLSKDNDAQRAIDGTTASDYTFHTGKEKTPYWQVEFENSISPSYIIINNRKHERWCENSAPIEISVVNEEGKTIVIHKGLLYFGSLPDNLPLILPLASKLEIKKIILKMDQGKESYIHLSSINVLIKRYTLSKPNRPLFFANRVDGFGMRICAIMIAMVYAKKFNGEFFFSWYNRNNSIYDTYHITNNSKDIFDDDFAKKHVIKKSEIDSMDLRDVYDYGKSSSESEVDGYLCDYRHMKSVSNFVEPDSFYNAFNELISSEKLMETKAIARNVELGKKSVAIHIRSGDLVYENYRLFHTFHYKVIPAFVIPALIKKYKKQGYDVILFGQEDSFARHLCSKYLVRYSKDFISSDFDSTQLGVFDVTLMSRVSLIISMGSAFTKAANLIGNNKVLKYNDVLTDREIIESFEEANNKDGLLNSDVIHDLYKSFAYIDFFKKYQNQISVSNKLEIIERSIQLEPDNQLNKLLRNVILLDTKNSYTANKDIIDLINSPVGYRFIREFISKRESLPPVDYVFKEYIPIFKSIAKRGYPSLAIITLMHEKYINEYIDISFYTDIVNKSKDSKNLGFDLLRKEIDSIIK